MSSASDLMNRLNERYSVLSKRQKLLAAYIIDNYDKAVFLTAEKLGEMVGVSESTVIRFAMHLGYKGYPQFQQALAELVRGKLNSGLLCLPVLEELSSNLRKQRVGKNIFILLFPLFHFCLNLMQFRL